MQPLTQAELDDPAEKEAMKKFEESVQAFVGTFDGELIYDHEVVNDAEDDPKAMNDEDNLIPADDAPTPDSGVGHDCIINTQMVLPRGDQHEMGQVLGCKRGSKGLLIGYKNRVPSLDSQVYTVHWADSQEEDFVYNHIAEHLYSQCDEKGNQINSLMLLWIIGRVRELWRSWTNIIQFMARGIRRRPQLDGNWR